MSKNSIVVPILYEKNGKILQLLDIVIMRYDNSIYITFPNDKDYKLSSQSLFEYQEKDYCETQHQMEEISDEISNPKISFHPRDMICHIKDPNNIKINDSYELLVNHFNDAEYIYLSQIVFGNNLEMYKEYKEKPNRNPLIIKNIDITKTTLNLEFLIHTNGFIPDENFLPISNNRLFRRCETFICNNKYSFTIYISTISKRHINLNNKILFTINTLNKGGIYILSKKD